MIISPYYLIERKNGLWSYGYRIDGKPFVKSTGQRDKKKADKVARREWGKLKRIKNSDDFDAEVETADRCFQVFKESRLNGADEKTLINHRNYAKRFTTYFDGEMMLSEISTLQIEKFKVWLQTQHVFDKGKKWKKKKLLAVKTQNQILTWLSSIYRYHKLTNPCVGVKRTKISKEKAMDKSIIFYSEKERKAIFKAAEKSVYRLPIKILWYSGMRPAEMLALKNIPEHINLENKTLTLIDKKQDIRTLDLQNNSYTKKAWVALLEWIKERDIQAGERLFPKAGSWGRKAWQRVLKNAGLEYKIQHVIRHQFVKHVHHNLGWDLSIISRWCGHKTNVCYELYSRVLVQSPKNENEEVEEGYEIETIKRTNLVLSDERAKQLKEDIRKDYKHREILRAAAKHAQRMENEAKKKEKKIEVEISESEYEKFLKWQKSQ